VSPHGVLNSESFEPKIHYLSSHYRIWVVAVVAPVASVALVALVPLVVPVALVGMRRSILEERNTTARGAEIAGTKQSDMSGLTEFLNSLDSLD